MKIEDLNIKKLTKIQYFIYGFTVMAIIWAIWALSWKPIITIKVGG